MGAVPALRAAIMSAVRPRSDRASTSAPACSRSRTLPKSPAARMSAVAPLSFDSLGSAPWSSSMCRAFLPAYDAAYMSGVSPNPSRTAMSAPAPSCLPMRFKSLARIASNSSAATAVTLRRPGSAAISASSGHGAPWSIQFRKTAISPSGSAPVGGMRIPCFEPVIRWIKRLSSAFPGTMTGPESPPCIARVLLSSRRWAVTSDGPWQAWQRCSRSGSTSRSKSTVVVAPETSRWAHRTAAHRISVHASRLIIGTIIGLFVVWPPG